MAETKIEWAHYTFNAWRGCTKVSDGCRHCYAETLSKRNPAVLGEWGPGAKRVVAAESYWREPLRWNHQAILDGVRRRVFAASLSDVFDAEAPVAEQVRLFDLIEECDALDWLVLTKRPENALAFLQERYGPRGLWSMPVPFNLWLGVSIENQAAADERIPILMQIPAAVRFLSMEPLLEHVSLGSVPIPSSVAGPLHWVIVGGESGPKARPMHPSWVRSLREQCRAAGVPFFFKQWGEWAPIDGRYQEREGDVLFPDPDAPAAAWHMRNLVPAHWMRKVGKKAAGRTLDGREWAELPST